MKQVVQSTSGGDVKVVEVPRPSPAPTEVLVRTEATIISPGTERAVTQLAQSSLMAKARARPDLARQVIKKAKAEGIAQTYRSVKSRLDEDIPLGYSGAGTAVEVGEFVREISPGQLVATAGAGKANHAEYQAVPGLLCGAAPDGVAAADAAFSTIASIALHGLRLAEVGPGSKVVVIGLGLVGQLSVRLAQAAGCRVAGMDLAQFPVDKAGGSGAYAVVEAGEETTKAIVDWTRGIGADAVLITAGGSSSNAIMRTPAICRDRATVVVVGNVGLHLSRTPFYEKELTLRFARSYGPGRYELTYEDWGVDYPPGFVRWTEGRNLEAVMDLIADGRLRVDDLVTHSFGIEDAVLAYQLIEQRSEPFLGIRIDYLEKREIEEPIRIRPRSVTGEPGIGFIGAGGFAGSVLVPAMQKAGFTRFVSVASASGLSAHKLAERGGFEKAVSGAGAVIDDPAVDVVVIATPHDSHARLAAQALYAGKDVFCEKPLALSLEELEDVEAAQDEGGGVLFVGFNRRFSKSIALVKEQFQTSAPLVITYRVNAGRLPGSHWYNDRRQGGRLLGEICHFVDTCIAIAGAVPDGIQAFGSGRKELLLSGDFLVSLRFPNGTLASIVYASNGHTSTEKERIEVLGFGNTAAVIDFREVVLNGKSTRIRLQDKGHDAEISSFRTALLNRDADPKSVLVSTRAVLRAAATLGGACEDGGRH